MGWVNLMVTESFFSRKNHFDLLPGVGNDLGNLFVTENGHPLGDGLFDVFDDESDVVDIHGITSFPVGIIHG